MKQLRFHRVWFRVSLLVFTIGTVHSRKVPRLQKLWGCWDRIGRVGRLCNWLTILVDLPTGCSRRLLLHEQHVYLLICFVESMVTHSSQTFYETDTTGLLGEVVKGSAVNSKTPFLIANFPSDADRWNARTFESNECNLFQFVALWFKSDVSIQVTVSLFDCSCRWWWWWWLFLYSAILPSRTDSLRSHVILHEWLAFYSAFFNIHRSGVLTVLAWLVPHETAAISTRSVYTIQLCTMSPHAKTHT